MAHNFDQIQRVTCALNALKVLRASVGHIFESLAGGVRPEDGANSGEYRVVNKFILVPHPDPPLLPDDGKYLVELQEQLNAVTVNLRDVESTIGGLQAPQGMLSLGNTSYLSQETTIERQNLYPLLVNSYKWIEKVCTHPNITSLPLTILFLSSRSMPTAIWRRRC